MCWTSRQHPSVMSRHLVSTSRRRIDSRRDGTGRAAQLCAVEAGGGRLRDKGAQTLAHPTQAVSWRPARAEAAHGRQVASRRSDQLSVDTSVSAASDGRGGRPRGCVPYRPGGAVTEAAGGFGRPRDTYVIPPRPGAGRSPAPAGAEALFTAGRGQHVPLSAAADPADGVVLRCCSAARTP
ncbi:hypothetical protein FJT64_011737 [Amphibalanus amphitrite]|uniref:Uncharacterized protein n=1 Tax=Amphibalanus amphitrite TaxID=1232801 RepID=A0A6A4VHT5_AMPAM|nr:hypothetical protein FJT64_011737 [Amphibalanus amphitrite]